MPTCPALTVIGGRSLHGTVTPQGSKSAAVLLQAAAFLTAEPVWLTNMPAVLDVTVITRIAGELGHRASAVDDGFQLVPARAVPRGEVPPELGRRIRVTPTLAAAILARDGWVRFPLPGGDAFCSRPIDRHLAAMRAAGADVTQDLDGRVTARLPRGRPRPVKFSADTVHGPSVGATVTALLLAARARGTSLITEPSPDPETGQVCDFLRGCGVPVSRRFDGAVEVAGVEELRGTRQEVPPDRIEAGTLAIAAVLTRGSITVRRCPPTSLPETFWSFLSGAGASVEFNPDGFTVSARSVGDGQNIQTAPFPGFPSDLQPQATVLGTQLRGSTSVTEHVYAARASHVAGLQQFGARIHAADRTVIAHGPTRLRGTTVTGQDIRCVVAYLLAGLVASDESTVYGGRHLHRGHADFVGQLCALGAEIYQDRGAVSDR